MLTFDNVVFRYGKKTILQGLSFTLRPGEILFLAGPNGCGKSTALALAAGTLKPASGSVTRTGTLGISPQDCPLFDDMTVLDNLKFFARLAGVPLPAQLPLPVDGYLKKRVRRLSGGMRKAVSLCCAFLGEPDLLILDEPSAALDTETREMLYSYLNERAAAGTAILLTGHEPGETQRLAGCTPSGAHGTCRMFTYAADVFGFI